MKKIYALFFGLFIIGTAKAQIINFTDITFKNTLLLANTTNSIANDLWNNSIKIDVNNDGEIQVSEAQLVVYLDIHDRGINNVTGISNFTNLKYFKCYLNNLTTLDVNANTALVSLQCYANNLSSLSLVGLPNLYSVDCGFNVLQTLNLNNVPALDFLRCPFNLLTTINFNNSSNVTTLQCFNNNFTSLNFSGLNTIQSIACSNNQITTLNLDDFPTLTGIDCSYNNLSSVIVNNPNLTGINCSYNNITSLAINHPNLGSLNCSNNLLTTVNISNCQNLNFLYCQNNSITSLSFSGLENLYIVDCSNNQLNSLTFQDSNNSEISLSCSFNNLVTLDLGSIKIQSLYCSNNNLETIFIKDSLIISSLYLADNPNLRYVCGDENEFNLITNSLYSSGYFSCNVNSYCSFTPGGTYYSIVGNSKLDINGIGCSSTNPVYPNLKFNLTSSSNSGFFVSDDSGNYEIPLQVGTHTITPILENLNYYIVSPATLQVNFPSQISPFNQNFCVTPNGNHNDLEVTLIPIIPARPGFNSSYKIVYKNKGTVSQSGSVVFNFEDDKMDLVTTVPNFNSQSTNSITWNFTNLLPLESNEIELVLNINSPTETPAVNIGNQLNFESTINPLTGDENLSDNYSNLKQIVVGSYDPNDKTCIEGTIVGTSVIGQYVHYVIRFENTGTFAAENVVVKDMIDLNKFDLNTLIPISSSHSFVTRIDNLGKAEFIFEGINLPFDDANNDGYVAFKIKTNPTLVVGSTFSNTASIFFDYNFPIVTNTATTTIQALGTNDFEFTTYFTLYPNPAKEVVTILAKEDVSISSIGIYNTLGQLVLVEANPNASIDVSGLKTGNYFVKIISDKGITTTKLRKY